MTTFETLTIEVINVNGNSLYAIQKEVTSGINSIQLDMQNFSTGVYFLNISSAKGVMTRKFVR